MRVRINVRVNIDEVAMELSAKYERRRIIFNNAVRSIMDGENVSYKEAKSILKNQLRFDVMKREIQLLNT